MWLALGIVAGSGLAALAYLLRCDGRFRVRRSLAMKVAAEEVFSAVSDLATWPLWSPWLVHEPDAKIEYGDDCRRDGGFYTWDGKLVGAGKLTHSNLEANSRIEQQLEFRRPYRSTSRVSWDIEAREGETLVSWEMSGKMPFLFRFMAARMEPMLGRDFELGLALLAGYLDAESPHPKIEFAGSETLEDFSYWSIPCNGNLRQLEAARQPAIDSLTAAAAGKTGLALTLYHDFDPAAGQYRAEIAVPIDRVTPDSNYTRREFAGGRYLRMKLCGDHRFLPLGWHALYAHSRMSRLKTDRARPALEIYQVTPRDAADGNRIETVLCLPLRGRGEV